MKCTFCHLEKPIVHRIQSDMAKVNFKYCQQCYDVRKAKKECKVCGRLVAFEDYPKHNLDYHEGENSEWMDNFKDVFKNK